MRTWLWRLVGAQRHMNQLVEQLDKAMQAKEVLRLKAASLEGQLALLRGRHQELSRRVDQVAASSAQAGYTLQLQSRDALGHARALEAQLEVAIGVMDDATFAEFDRLKKALRPDRDPTAWARVQLEQLTSPNKPTEETQS